MSITSGFFNSVNGDKKYNADDINEYYKGILNDGVVKHYDADLKVEAASDMTVNVMGGKAICLGKYVKNTGALELAIEAGESQPRYDAIVVGVDLETRSANIYVKKGTAAADPSYPTIVNTDLNKELCLAYVYISANATSISNTDIIDSRSNAMVCGYVRLSSIEVNPSVTYTYDDNNDTYICDKTYAEIIDMLNNGIVPIVYIKHFIFNDQRDNIAIDISKHVDGVPVPYIEIGVKTIISGSLGSMTDYNVRITHKNNDTITYKDDQQDYKYDIDELQANVNSIKDCVYKYNNTNAIGIDTSKYNHLMIITSNRIVFLILNVQFPNPAGIGIGVTALVGNNLTLNYTRTGDLLTLVFDETQLPTFCYLLTY